MDSQVAIPPALDSLRHDRLHFLRHHADIGLVGAIVGKPVEPETAVETTEKDDVVLEGDIRPASAAPASEAPAAAETPAADTTPARRPVAMTAPATTSDPRCAVRLPVSRLAGGGAAGRPLRRPSGGMRRRALALAGLLASATVTRLCAIARLLLCDLGAVSARLQHLLALAAAKIGLALVPWPICSGKLLSHVGVIVRDASAVLRIVPPMLHVSAAVDVDVAAAPVDAATPEAPA